VGRKREGNGEEGDRREGEKKGKGGREEGRDPVKSVKPRDCKVASPIMRSIPFDSQ